MIDSLIAKSLVIRQHGGTLSRFRLFETTASYAEQRLADAGEAIPVRERHLDHYFGIAGRHPAAMWADLSARDTLGADRANVVAAFDWAASQDRWKVAARLLLGAFAVFYAHRVEGIDLVGRCLEHLDNDDDLAVRLRSNEYWLHLLVLDMPAANAIVRSLRDAPTPVEQFQGYLFLGPWVSIRS
ncbi:MAG: putative ATPase [Acidimicrobiales bacterium]|jgi:predicted ATPase